MADLFIIKKPWITEKATDLHKVGQYVFMVKPTANKNEIKKAIKELYRVDVIAIQTIRRPVKTKRFRPTMKVRDAYKKAIVTLKEGQKIDTQ